MRLRMLDAQQAMEFLLRQATHIEPQVYRVRYADIQYPALIPVDTSANQWAKSVTYFSLDKVGKAKWISGMGNDIPRADVSRAKYEQTIDMAGIGYGYTLEEIGFAQQIPGTNLGPERASAAKRAYEEFVEDVAFNGDTNKGWEGLINNSNVTRVDVANDGTGPSRLWSTKTADQIIRDVNDQLSAVYTGTLTVEMADTVLLPYTRLNTLASMRIPSTEGNALEWLKKYNVYTQTTSAPLTIRGINGLDTAGAGDTARMVVYRKDPDVLKMHIPMVHQFLPVWQTGPMEFDIPGIFRIGGVEIRRPAAVRYADGI